MAGGGHKSSWIQSPRADLQEGMGRSLRGQGSALILALFRFGFCAFLVTALAGLAGMVREDLVWSGFGSDFGSPSGPVRFS